MTLLALVAIIFFGFATYNLTCAFVDIPTKKTSRMMMLARKQQGVKSEKLLDVYITKIAGLIAPYLKLDKLKRNKLQRALDIAGLELTPEVYTARAWVTAGAVGLSSILVPRYSAKSLPLNALIFSPESMIWPEVGFMIVAMQFSSVVFPEPLAPIIPKYSPGKTSKVMPFKALVGTPSLL